MQVSIKPLKSHHVSQISKQFTSFNNPLHCFIKGSTHRFWFWPKIFPLPYFGQAFIGFPPSKIGVFQRPNGLEFSGNTRHCGLGNSLKLALPVGFTLKEGNLGFSNTGGRTGPFGKFRALWEGGTPRVASLGGAHHWGFPQKFGPISQKRGFKPFERAPKGIFGLWDMGLVGTLGELPGKPYFLIIGAPFSRKWGAGVIKMGGEKSLRGVFATNFCPPGFLGI